MIETEGSIPIPKILREDSQDDEIVKYMSDNNIKSGKQREIQTEFKNIDRVKNLIKRESKGLPEGERVVAVKAGTIWLGKIISNSDIIKI